MIGVSLPADTVKQIGKIEPETTVANLKSINKQYSTPLSKWDILVNLNLQYGALYVIEPSLSRGGSSVFEIADFVANLVFANAFPDLNVIHDLCRTDMQQFAWLERLMSLYEACKQHEIFQRDESF